MCPADEVKNKGRGYIIPIGGAEEKLDNPEILDRFVDVCGGKTSRISIISTASELEDTGRVPTMAARGAGPDLRGTPTLTQGPAARALQPAGRRPRYMGVPLGRVADGALVVSPSGV